jgi:hypothetical protein
MAQEGYTVPPKQLYDQHLGDADKKKLDGKINIAKNAYACYQLDKLTKL